MTAGSVARAILKPIAVAVGLVVAVVATPVIGVLGVAAWQEYAPESLRVVVYRASALTEADDVGGVVDNLVAALDPTARPPG